MAGEIQLTVSPSVWLWVWLSLFCVRLLVNDQKSALPLASPRKLSFLKQAQHLLAIRQSLSCRILSFPPRTCTPATGSIVFGTSTLTVQLSTAVRHSAIVANAPDATFVHRRPYCDISDVRVCLERFLSHEFEVEFIECWVGGSLLVTVMRIRKPNMKIITQSPRTKVSQAAAEALDRGAVRRGRIEDVSPSNRVLRIRTEEVIDGAPFPLDQRRTALTRVLSGKNDDLFFPHFRGRTGCSSSLKREELRRNFLFQNWATWSQ